MVDEERQHDLDDLGIAKTARMLAMYKEHVLGEKPTPGMVPLSAIAPAAPKVAKKEEVGSFGD